MRHDTPDIKTRKISRHATHYANYNDMRNDTQDITTCDRARKISRQATLHAKYNNT